MSRHTLHRIDTLRDHLEYCPDNVLIDLVDDEGNVYRIEKIGIKTDKVTVTIKREEPEDARSPLCNDRP